MVEMLGHGPRGAPEIEAGAGRGDLAAQGAQLLRVRRSVSGYECPVHSASSVPASEWAVGSTFLCPLPTAHSTAGLLRVRLLPSPTGDHHTRARCPLS